MSKESTGKFFLVRENSLPTALLKTIKVKELIHSGNFSKVKDAVKSVGLSRSGYYKYKDAIFPFEPSDGQKIVTVVFTVENSAEILGNIFSLITECGGLIVAINKNISVGNAVQISLSVDTEKLNKSVRNFFAELEKIDGVHKLEQPKKS